jgi:hypothetical protein
MADDLKDAERQVGAAERALLDANGHDPAESSSACGVRLKMPGHCVTRLRN